MIEFKLVRAEDRDAFDVYLYDRGDDGEIRAVAEMIEFVPIASGDLHARRAFSIRGADVYRQTFGGLMDSLWGMGVRPSELTLVKKKKE